MTQLTKDECDLLWQEFVALDEHDKLVKSKSSRCRYLFYGFLLGRHSALEKTEWQLIETIPEDTLVLLIESVSDGPFVGFRKNGIYVENVVNSVVSENITFKPTHWMPLPKAPAREVQS